MRRKAAAVALVLWAGAAALAEASPIEELTGYWTGGGTLLLAERVTEKVKCAVIYKVGGGGTLIKQTIRCASADYNINAVAELRVNGGQVAGNWEEKTYSATGQVSGRYTGSSFVLSIQGANFTAAMDLGLNGTCKQTIRIQPKGLEIKRISISLAKC
jgi:hypothetical protein